MPRYSDMGQKITTYKGQMIYYNESESRFKIKNHSAQTLKDIKAKIDQLEVQKFKRIPCIYGYNGNFYPDAEITSKDGHSWYRVTYSPPGSKSKKNDSGYMDRFFEPSEKNLAIIAEIEIKQMAIDDLVKERDDLVRKLTPLKIKGE